ncbi:unnamed protein product [Somion occarium]|uniref:NADP-dependent oxidoreductase domain-containing protein n=1 Tax=Somion occarium TaxID=3059160 RepID=A0ABP1E304_9APHY
MSFFAQPPTPATKLGYHRKLAPAAGLHVSPIALGAMSIGDKWSEWNFGTMDKESSFKLLDAFYEAGGNFIDTSSNYQDESSEEFIGEWMEARGIREQMVIATKYGTNYKRGDPTLKLKTGFVGNNVKSMHNSVEASLKKLRTDHIDILYLHWWDYTTPVEEVMNALHNLVVQGKVLYLGVSDTPAFIVSKANTYARLTGKTPFVIYEGAWSILQRDFEREILLLAKVEGMALAPWNVLAGGKIRTDAEEQRRRESGEKGRMILSPNWERTADERKSNTSTRIWRPWKSLSPLSISGTSKASCRSILVSLTANSVMEVTIMRCTRTRDISRSGLMLKLSDLPRIRDRDPSECFFRHLLQRRVSGTKILTNAVISEWESYSCNGR